MQLGMRSGEIIGIGSLEAKVLRALYEQEGWLGVATVWERLKQDDPVDRSTVITCLRRMADKGYLQARKSERGAWLFRPAVSAYELGLALIQGVWEHLWGPPPAALSHFVTDALTGRLGGSGVSEKMKQVAREAEDFRLLVEDLSSPPLPARTAGTQVQASAPVEQPGPAHGRRSVGKRVAAKS